MTKYWAEHLAWNNLNTPRKIRGSNDNNSQSASQSVFIYSVRDAHAQTRIQLEQRLWEQKTTWTHMHAET